MIPISGWVPDGDMFAPGVLSDVDNVIPVLSGHKTAPSLQAAGVDALAAASVGAAAVRKLDNSVRLFAGTTTKLYEWASSAWTDRSAVGDYTLGTANLWQFVQFGDATIAAAKTETLQVSTTGAFAAIAGAPKASHIDSVEGFVMIADYDDGTDTPDGWHSSAIGDHTDWTPAIATQCANGRLIDTPGPITGLKSLQGYMVAYKASSMYLGQYTGGANPWSWGLVSRDVGALSPGAIASRKTEHYIMSSEDFYIFDGSRPQSIGKGVRKWFFKTELLENFRNRVRSLIDSDNTLVYWFYPSRSSGGSLDRWIAYNYETGQWGKGTLSIEVPVQWQSNTLTIDDMDGLSATIDGLPSISMDSPFWSSSSKIAAIIDTAHTVKSFDGGSSGGSVTTGDIGSDGAQTMLKRIRPRYLAKPTSTAMTNYYRNDLDDSLVEDQTVAESDGNCDVLRSSRWHRVRLTFTGDATLNAIHAELRAQGDR